MGRRVFGADFKDRRRSCTQPRVYLPYVAPTPRKGLQPINKGVDMSDAALCPETADSETFVEIHERPFQGVRARPRHELVSAHRYEKVARSFKTARPWIEKAKLTLLLTNDGNIYYQLNYIYTKKYHGRETRNPWKILKSLKELSYHAVATVAHEWNTQGYMVVVAPVKRIKAELAVMALADFGKGF